MLTELEAKYVAGLCFVYLSGNAESVYSEISNAAFPKGQNNERTRCSAKRCSPVVSYVAGSLYYISCMVAL